MATYSQQLPPAYGLAGANQQLQIDPRLLPGAQLNPANAFSMQRSSGGGVGNADYGYINQNRDMAMQQSQAGINALQGYAQPGMAAQGMQANLTGANGVDAQRAAYQNFQSSPGQQWLIDQAERGLTRNAAAIGGLGGGNVRQELQRQAMGLAQQDFQNQFNNLGAVGDRGMQAAQLQTGLRDSAGGYASQAGGYGANLQQSQIGAGAQLGSAQIGANSALERSFIDSDVAKYLGNLTSQTQLARDRGQYAYQAGQDIANNGYNTTSALAQLANQQGSGLSDMYGAYTGNIANLLAGAGGAQADSYGNLATLLTNIANGTQGNFVGASQLPQVGQTTGNLGGFGNLLGGAGSLYGAINGGGAAAATTPTVSSAITAMFPAISASDRRLKTNITRVGTTPGGNGLYSWDWTDEGRRVAGSQPAYGVIAQEVNQDAVVMGSDGWLRVDYARVL